ncbi:hypothetical protein K458DRAFT_152438 [Lentithecium fluviatile CBS 122367]|uniref:Uncharacterized protein n=1 Tax=Lentithecium fluviatile CBS 122367 TaxID=1168545 RepID=A0A6G1JF12_9PLEO|nr:hypothetical protein K458DRAFT_152438 [Lentithecium fluviatile CBS 122367]
MPAHRLTMAPGNEKHDGGGNTPCTLLCRRLFFPLIAPCITRHLRLASLFTLFLAVFLSLGELGKIVVYRCLVGFPIILLS